MRWPSGVAGEPRVDHRSRSAQPHPASTTRQPRPVWLDLAAQRASLCRARSARIRPQGWACFESHPISPVFGGARRPSSPSDRKRSSYRFLNTPGPVGPRFITSVRRGVVPPRILSCPRAILSMRSLDRCDARLPKSLAQAKFRSGRSRYGYDNNRLCRAGVD